MWKIVAAVLGSIGLIGYGVGYSENKKRKKAKKLFLVAKKGQRSRKPKKTVKIAFISAKGASKKNGSHQAVH